MRRRTFITACTSIALIPLLGMQGCSTSLSRADAGGAGNRRTLRYGFALENPSGVTLTNQKFWFYAPVKTTALQKLQSVDVSMPHQILNDALGNTVISVALPPLPPYATKLLSVEAQVAIAQTPATQSDKTELFLGAEPFVEVDDPAVMALARALRQETDMATVQAVYDWVKGNLRYAGFVAEDQGALQALQKRGGDCTEYAYLVCALARANRIPARVMGGYVTEHDAVLQAESYHNWAEVLISGRWQVIDAQRGRFMHEADQYMAFQVFSSRVPNELQSFHRFRVEGGIKAMMS